MDRKKVYIDMDGVLCDYMKSYNNELLLNPDQRYPQSKFGFYMNLEAIENSIESVNKLKEQYDVWILTKPSYKNLNCYSEKAYWIRENLGEDMLDKLIISPDKSIVKGDYLIDDQTDAGQLDFEGELLLFGEGFNDWTTIIKYLIDN